MVRLGTKDCAGCSVCCHGMDNMIVLDPYDVFRLGRDGGLSFDDLLAKKYISLSVIDSLVLPCLAMRETENAGKEPGTEEGENPCMFLNEEGRCSIHAYRPGLCRLYPLGRYYEGNDFSYILQVHECGRMKTKVRISQWLGEPQLPVYEQYIKDWHRLVRDLGNLVDSSSRELGGRLCVQLLQTFFRRGWDYTSSFYPQFDQLLPESRRAFSLAP